MFKSKVMILSFIFLSKQNIQSQAGSMTLALANPNAGNVQRLVS
jgi:hypothetical protein